MRLYGDGVALVELQQRGEACLSSRGVTPLAKGRRREDLGDMVDRYNRIASSILRSPECFAHCNVEDVVVVVVVLDEEQRQNFQQTNYFGDAKTSV
jgi:hypothetical protein